MNHHPKMRPEPCKPYESGCEIVLKGTGIFFVRRYNNYSGAGPMVGNRTFDRLEDAMAFLKETKAKDKISEIMNREEVVFREPDSI